MNPTKTLDNIDAHLNSIIRDLWAFLDTPRTAVHFARLAVSRNPNMDRRNVRHAIREGLATWRASQHGELARGWQDAQR